MFNKILVLAPHTDDAEIGCGATIARLTEENKEVYVAVFSIASQSVPQGEEQDALEKEFLRAIPFLGVDINNTTVFDYPVRRFSYHRQDILEDLIKLRSKIQPDLIFLPSANDIHQDHGVIYKEGIRAFKNSSILGYELPWNTYSFATQFFVSCSQDHFMKKWKALENYKTQVIKGREYFNKDFIMAWGKVRGIQAKKEYAEAFEVVRMIW